MSASRRGAIKGNQNDTLLNLSPAPFRSDTLIVADELFEAADAIKWPRTLGKAALEKTTDHLKAAGHSSIAELSSGEPVRIIAGQGA